MSVTINGEVNGQPVQASAATLDDASRLYQAAEKAAKPVLTRGEQVAEHVVTLYPGTGISIAFGDEGRVVEVNSLDRGRCCEVLRSILAAVADRAIAEEREACRAIAQSHANFGSSPYENGFRHAAEVIEQEIRQRK